ncbi:Mov34/MPN/PAD-1 family protein [Thalassobacillus pellis]|uniref:Mov34/MPN/PAD-1 family protein n=1 Tax=Thalassobacillus pellis TaxID=748008 RepID=UPI001960A5BF|nr:M67 family metallopeptidase [Thalassobacillus pellis]MBM7553618.1 proteasome lid subunit RPN8/RPN11 [Thalassobacillus pellis]
MNKFIIPTPIYEEMILHGSANLPYEVCGLLAGFGSEVKSIWKLENERKSEKSFFVSKQVVEETLKYISERKEQVLAVYHSHPTTAPVPSSMDIHNHQEEEIKMVIISYKYKHPEMKCYQVINNGYMECPFFIKTP